MGYYDLDDILADATRIPCRFNTTVAGLAYLEGNPTHSDTSSTTNAIKKGTRLDLPIWLSENLAVVTIPFSGTEEEEEEEEKAFIELLPPTYTSGTILNALKSSPTTIPLNTINKYFYSFVEKWSTLFQDEELVNVITEVLKKRVDEINNFAQVYRGPGTTGNAGAAAGSVEFISGLDEFEKELFRIGSESYKDVHKWLRNETN